MDRSNTQSSVTYFKGDLDVELDQRPLEFGLIRRLFGYARNCRWQRNWLFILVTVRSVQIPLLAWSIGAIIKGPVANQDWEGLVWGSAGFALLAISADVMFHFRQRYALELGESVVHDLRSELMGQLLKMPMSFYQNTKVGRLISRMTSDIEAVRAGVQDVLFVTIVQGGQMVVSAALMLYYNWLLFCVILAMAPFLWYLNRYFRKKLSLQTRVTQESFSRVTSTLAESVTGIHVTQGFAREAVNLGFFRNLCADHGRYNMNLARTSSLLTPILELNSQFFISVLVTLGGYLALQPDGGGVVIGDLIMFFFLANIFFAPISLIAMQYNQALVAMAGAERVFRMIDAKPEWEDEPDAGEVALRGAVEFRDVTFGYDAAHPVIRKFNLKAEPGATIALVGHTGSGKSTIINLLSKFYLPTQGELFLDGVEIRKITSASLHSQMGIVLQQNVLFTGTVMENIRFARPEASDEEVVDATRRLDCLEMIAELPQGFATEVGEHGASLSLGQRQLVCFARALLADPKILILDEATSSIDTVSEARLQVALEKLLVGRTSFVVAHRLSTIRHADKVLVLDHGDLVEEGTHDTLLAAGGVYAKLYEEFSRSARG